MNDCINIILASDDGYIPHAAVMMTSVLENTRTPDKIHFFLLDAGVSVTNRKILDDISTKYNAAIDFLTINKSLFTDFYVSHHINHTSYFRIVAPTILPKTVERAIYLDCDLIVTKDINDMSVIDIKGATLAAVSDPYGSERVTELDIKNKRYFNAGVLLIDITKWNENNLTEKIIDYIKENNNLLKFWDQDAINGVVQGEWFELDYRWNAQKRHFDDMNESNLLNPFIIHYTSDTKPWHIHSKHPLKSKYIEYSNKTVFGRPDFLAPSLKKRMLKTKNVVFGAGELAKSFIEYTDADIAYVIDNNPQRYTEKFNNYCIKSPTVLQNELKSKLTILVCSMYFKEISEQLNAMSFVENEHYYQVR
ncbi:glycosyltransferase family 8 protein [Sporosarcina sp. PTS2304]|uniref:glycosyltransferase family 8 protein n=1 Tax=Sporosarcina sp. PTS2304 TaxID=2283194 RepID=UPI000E0DD9F7|nr:glycosyltransferase family 8 protein [Sporosarcina sp. PTS2304]AXH98440.1 glycosyltransferase family 8 protein [Sporosarcina sp. PTS2304]